MSKKAFPCCLVLTKICVVRVLGPAVAKTTVPPTVGNFDWIVWNTRRSPLAHDIGITVNSELSNESWKDAEESAVIIESLGYEFLKIEENGKNIMSYFVAEG